MGDTFLQYPFLGTFPHQVPIHQHVMLAVTNEAFSFGLVSGYVSAGEVLVELFPLIYDQQRYCKYQLLSGGNFLSFLLFLNRRHKEVLNEDPRWNHGARRAYLR